MKNVLFEVDKSELKTESFVELDQLADYLNRNATLHIEIGGHTDNTGTEAAQRKHCLEERAQSVYTYLISQDIDAARRLTYQRVRKQPARCNQRYAGRSGSKPKNRNKDYEKLVEVNSHLTLFVLGKLNVFLQVSSPKKCRQNLP